MRHKPIFALRLVSGILGILVILILADVAAPQSRPRFEANWESLDARPTPQWFRDAKFGIFVCWGLYSVPAWSPKGTYAEWYQYFLQENSMNGQVYGYHTKTYGKNFKYADFYPLFKAELWNPEEWTDLFQKAGAKYIVLTTKHHAGDCLWPSQEASRAYGRPWNTMEIGPKRDIVGALTAAVRSKGIRMGLYYSLYEWYHPLWKNDKKRFIDEHLFPQFKDLVTRYRPDIVWSDGEWDLTSAEWKSPELLAWLFNTAPNEQDLVINDRWGKDARHKHGGFYTTEYGSGLADDTHPWEESRGIGSSYGYNRNEDFADYRSARELILMLVDIVSRGGNLCLDIGPRADGEIPVIMQERLLQIGNWLGANGEAIYGTRMWRTPCQWSEGKRPETKRGEFMTGFNILKETLEPDKGQAVKEVFFTRKNNDLYAITPRWPGKTLVIKEFEAARKSRVTWLATGHQLKWKNKKGSLVIDLPDFNPEELTPALLSAYAFRITNVTK
jgi:alpha-L-fucosidase